jgi:hypothetical protein
MSTVRHEGFIVHDEASMASELSSVIKVVQIYYASCVSVRRKNMARLGERYSQIASSNPESQSVLVG